MTRPSDTELLETLIAYRLAITEFDGTNFLIPRQFEIRDRDGIVIAVDADPRRAIETAGILLRRREEKAATAVEAAFEAEDSKPGGVT